MCRVSVTSDLSDFMSKVNVTNIFQTMLERLVN